jgi:phage repressor protein C with HTH and peptisase S24 domain
VQTYGVIYPNSKLFGLFYPHLIVNNYCMADNKVELGERLQEIRTELGFKSARQFALSIGADVSYYSKAEKGGGLSEEYLLQITEKYGYTKSWLLFGEGNKFLDGSVRIPSAADKSLRKPKTQSSVFLVPFVDIPAQAGYTKAYSDIDYIETLKHYPILPDVDPMGATWRYFQVEGDSMEPEIRAKDTILASLVIKEDWPDIKDFYTHVIVTESELLIKDVFKDSTKKWILLSANPDYPARSINLEEIKQVWVLRRHVKNRITKHQQYDIKQIKKTLK